MTPQRGGSIFVSCEGASTSARWRPDPVRFDVGLAIVLVVAAELEIWLTNDAGGYRTVATIVAPVLAASVAVRRLYPLLAGLVGAGNDVPDVRGLG